GRGELKGAVLIQTFYPEHYAIQDAVKQDYTAFFERELHFRRMMAYPPFTSLANVIVRDTSLEKAIRWSRQLSEYFSPHDGESVRILGPATAPLARLKKEHRFQFLLKSPKRSVLTKVLTGAMAYCDAKAIPQTAVLVDMEGGVRARESNLAEANELNCYKNHGAGDENDRLQQRAKPSPQ